MLYCIAANLTNH